MWDGPDIPHGKKAVWPVTSQSTFDTSGSRGARRCRVGIGAASVGPPAGRVAHDLSGNCRERWLSRYWTRFVLSRRGGTRTHHHSVSAPSHLYSSSPCSSIAGARDPASGGVARAPACSAEGRATATLSGIRYCLGHRRGSSLTLAWRSKGVGGGGREIQGGMAGEAESDGMIPDVCSWVGTLDV